jgi:hypothetical protein
VEWVLFDSRIALKMFFNDYRIIRILLAVTENNLIIAIIGAITFVIYSFMMQ